MNIFSSIWGNKEGMAIMSVIHLFFVIKSCGIMICYSSLTNSFFVEVIFILSGMALEVINDISKNADWKLIFKNKLMASWNLY